MISVTGIPAHEDRPQRRTYSFCYFSSDLVLRSHQDLSRALMKEIPSDWPITIYDCFVRSPASKEQVQFLDYAFHKANYCIFMQELSAELMPPEFWFYYGKAVSSNKKHSLSIAPGRDAKRFSQGDYLSFEKSVGKLADYIKAYLIESDEVTMQIAASPGLGRK